MTLATTKSKPQQASLLPNNDETTGFPGLDRIGDRFARGMRQIIADFGCNDVLITRAQSKVMTYDALCNDHEGLGAYCRFRLDPIKGNALLTLTSTLIPQLVDIFYGGMGDVDARKEEFTASEQRFIARIGEQSLPLFQSIWAEVVELNPSFLGVETDITETAIAKKSDLVVVQSFAVHGGPIEATTINCVYPVAALRPHQALYGLSQPEQVEPVDQEWRDSLKEAVMQARLPLRTIFARPELPVAKLLTLKAGDFIPLCLPNHLPVTVAGRLFAQSTVGESNGRAAIRIVKIEEGNNEHE